MTKNALIKALFVMAWLFYACEQSKESDDSDKNSAENRVMQELLDSLGDHSPDHLEETKASTAVEERINSVSELRRRLIKQPSYFVIKANRDTVIKCREGTLLSIPANAFLLASNKQTVTGELRISVREFYTTSDMIIAGLNTTSHKKLLETAGMVNIKVSSASTNDSCVLKPGKKITLAMLNADPNRLSDMQVFNGVHDSSHLTWEPKAGMAGMAQRWRADRSLFSQGRESAEPEFVFPDDVLLSKPALINSKPENLKMEIKMSIRELVQYGKSATRKAYGFIDTLGDLYCYKIGNRLQDVWLKNVYSPKVYNGMKVNLAVEVFISYSADYNYEYFQKVFGLGKGNPDSLISVSAELKPGLKIVSIDKIKKQYSNAITVSQFRSLQRRRSYLRKEYESKIQRLKLEAEENLVKSEQESNQSLKVAREYFLLNTTELGWINCDIFNQDQNTVDFLVKLQEKANLLIVFDSIRSILPGNAEGLFEKVPVNKTITIVGLKTENGKLLMAYHRTVTTKEPFEKLKFEPVSVATFKSRLEKLNKL